MYYIPEFLDAVDNYGIYLIIVAIAVWLVTGFYMVPKLFIYLCLTTKIELMKEKNIVEEVIAESRKNNILKTVKVYRQMKMIYREIKGREEGEEKAEILEFMRKISEEVFLLVSTNRKTIHVTELDEVLGLLGIVLSEDELRLFAKECSPDKNNFVTRTGFRIAIERILYGYEMNPHEVVNYIMNQQFNKKQKISINDMNDFFSEWAWHFKEEDLRDFLLETQTLADELGYFKHEEIANLMRINIEACPK